MTDNLRGNVIEVCSTGDSQVVLALSGDRERAVPMFSCTDTHASHWLFELNGPELVRIFRQLESLLTATEADVQEWVDELRGGPQPDNPEGSVMQFVSRQPVSDSADEQPVALAGLALELTGGDVDELARQIPADVIRIDDIGRRAVSRATARWLFAQHAERRAEQARRVAQRRQRMAELSERNRAQLRGGIPTQSSGAFADLLAVDQ